MVTIQLSFDPAFKKKIQKDGAKKEFTVQLDKNKTLRDVVRRFIPEEELGHIGIIIVNKNFQNLEYIVQDGDRINVLPLLFGG